MTCAALAIASLSACANAPPVEVGAVASEPVSALGQDDYSATLDPAYVLRPSDVISITVFREPDFSVERLPIGSDGTVALPLVGTVTAAGKGAQDLSRELTWRLDEAGLKHPSVTINVLDHASHLVTVEGGVEEPGVYPFQPGARLSSALALANGPNRVAKLREVAIFRETPDGLAVAKFDYVEVRRGAMLDPVIQPGDRVVVGISGLSQFWQDFLRAMPAFGIFANAAR
ncbi:polysaccharide export outer membrane protein [Altererythrobacter xiamenensis]|uniref:Polysaccharide export outer membrane protein n=1 Tax=Altererythrobacter xiamenensis TaxID=1316679 RepID=A0A1Y6F4T1_9SPHN|nr:polysaccharide biosynthesis/export family protein [Altererythrobacter xiamenensis]SMQ69456.1 polysaccharide export outer membrane protein [Altererythrobacter xiamenensis]